MKGYEGLPVKYFVTNINSGESRMVATRTKYVVCVRATNRLWNKIGNDSNLLIAWARAASTKIVSNAATVVATIGRLLKPMMALDRGYLTTDVQRWQHSVWTLGAKLISGIKSNQASFWYFFGIEKHDVYLFSTTTVFEKELFQVNLFFTLRWLFCIYVDCWCLVPLYLLALLKRLNRVYINLTGLWHAGHCCLVAIFVFFFPRVFTVALLRVHFPGVSRVYY